MKENVKARNIRIICVILRKYLPLPFARIGKRWFWGINLQTTSLLLFVPHLKSQFAFSEVLNSSEIEAIQNGREKTSQICFSHEFCHWYCCCLRTVARAQKLLIKALCSLSVILLWPEYAECKATEWLAKCWADFWVTYGWHLFFGTLVINSQWTDQHLKSQTKMVPWVPLKTPKVRKCNYIACSSIMNCSTNSNFFGHFVGLQWMASLLSDSFYRNG